jgi:hypothetical protein
VFGIKPKSLSGISRKSAFDFVGNRRSACIEMAAVRFRPSYTLWFRCFVGSSISKDGGDAFSLDTDVAFASFQIPVIVFLALVLRGIQLEHVLKFGLAAGIGARCALLWRCCPKHSHSAIAGSFEIRQDIQAKPYAVRGL